MKNKFYVKFSPLALAALAIVGCKVDADSRERSKGGTVQPSNMGAQSNSQSPGKANNPTPKDGLEFALFNPMSEYISSTDIIMKSLRNELKSGDEQRRRMLTENYQKLQRKLKKEKLPNQSAPSFSLSWGTVAKGVGGAILKEKTLDYSITEMLNTWPETPWDLIYYVPYVGDIIATGEASVETAGWIDEVFDATESTREVDGKSVMNSNDVNRNNDGMLSRLKKLNDRQSELADVTKKLDSARSQGEPSQDLENQQKTKALQVSRDVRNLESYVKEKGLGNLDLSVLPPEDQKFITQGLGLVPRDPEAARAIFGDRYDPDTGELLPPADKVASLPVLSPMPEESTQQSDSGGVCEPESAPPSAPVQAVQEFGWACSIPSSAPAPTEDDPNATTGTTIEIFVPIEDKDTTCPSNTVGAYYVHRLKGTSTWFSDTAGPPWVNQERGEGSTSPCDEGGLLADRRSSDPLRSCLNTLGD